MNKYSSILMPKEVRELCNEKFRGLWLIYIYDGWWLAL